MTPTTLSGAAKVAGIIGWPVAHSRSPRLHGYWLRRYATDGAYVPLAVAPGRLAEALRALPALGFAGANVTIPHKEEALRVCDTADAAARRIGAVNTVVAGADGALHGSNTDAYGFVESLREGAPGWTAQGAPALMLGAGGAARAVAAALLDAGCPEIRICNRNGARAEALAREFGAPCKAAAWADRADAAAGAGLVANATSGGMTGKPALDMPLDRLDAGATVADIVYAPLVTPLIAAARRRGARTVDGLGMLLHQARPGFKAWFGIDPEVDAGLRAFVLADLRR